MIVQPTIAQVSPVQVDQCVAQPERCVTDTMAAIDTSKLQRIWTATTQIKSEFNFFAG